MSGKNQTISFAISLILGLNISAFSLSANAETQNKENDDYSDMSLEELLKIQIVYSASKKEQKTTKAPANTIIISEEEIKQRGYSNLKDVLADLPGIETIEYHFSEIGTLVPVRGVSGNNKIIVLVNGMKINPPARENMMFRNDESIRHAKRIEVVYGPGSALYGSDAVSAIINIVPKTAKDYKQDKNNGNVLLRGGMNNTYEGSLGLGYNITETSSFNGYLQYFNTNGTDYPSAYPDYFKGYLDVFNKSKPNEPSYTRWDTGLNGYLSLQVQDTMIQYYHRGSDRSSSQGLVSSFPFSNQARWKDSSNILRVENNLNIIDNLSASTSLTYNRYEIDPSTAYVWLLNDKYNYGDNKYGRGKALEFEERLSWDVLKDSEQTGGFSKNLSITAGAFAGDYESVPKATVTGGYKSNENLVSQGKDFVYYNSKEDLDTDKNPQSVSPIIDLSYQNYAGYLQADWQIIDTLSAVVGGRVDKDSRFNLFPFTPRATLIFNPLENLTMKAIYGKAFVFPPPYFTHAVYQNPLQINQPNSDIKPEDAQSVELNLTYALGNFSLNSSAYYNTQSDLFILGDGAPVPTIVKNEIWVNGSDKPLKLTQNANSGNSKMFGFDSLFKYKFTNDHSAFLTFSYVNGQFDVLGKTSGLDRISNVNVRLGGNFRLLYNWYISPRISWRSDPNFTADQISHLKDQLKNLYQIDLYTYYDVSNFRIFANFSNVTNNTYAMNGGYGPVPAELFTVTGGVDYNF